ncbi:putative reverse transcriptase domain-containing protein [Tanacetum coccineum]
MLKLGRVASETMFTLVFRLGGVLRQIGIRAFGYREAMFLSVRSFVGELFFLIELSVIVDPKEEPFEMEPLMELKEIVVLIVVGGVHEEIFQRLPLGRGMDVLSYGYAFWINQCTNGFHGLEEPGYYRRFIANSSKVAKPLASLTQKIRKYEWVKEQEEAFQTLKDNLCDTPILSLPDGSKEFVVYCDASNQGLGDVRTLMIDEAHASRILRSWWKIYFEALVDIAEGIENTAKTCVRLIILKRIDKAEVGESGLIRLSWYKRQPTRVEVGDKVMLEVSSWKDVVHLEKKEMLAPIYKYLADTNLHVHLEEIKVDKTFRFVEEPVGIIDREVKSLKRSRILIVKSIGTRSEWLERPLGFIGSSQLILFRILFHEFLNDFISYACSDSLLLTPLCCDDIHDVTPRVSALLCAMETTVCSQSPSSNTVITNYVRNAQSISNDSIGTAVAINEEVIPDFEQSAIRLLSTVQDLKRALLKPRHLREDRYNCLFQQSECVETQGESFGAGHETCVIACNVNADENENSQGFLLTLACTIGFRTAGFAHVGLPTSRPSKRVHYNVFQTTLSSEASP